MRDTPQNLLLRQTVSGLIQLGETSAKYVHSQRGRDLSVFWTDRDREQNCIGLHLQFHLSLDQAKMPSPDVKEGILHDVEATKHASSSPFSGKKEDGAASSRAVPCTLPPSFYSWGNGTSQFGHERRGRSPCIDWMHSSSIYHVLSRALLIF